MYCQRCGTLLPDGSTFCSRCGAPQGVVPGAPRAGWYSPSAPLDAKIAAENSKLTFANFYRKGWLFYIIIVVLTISAFFTSTFGKLIYCDKPIANRMALTRDEYDEIRDGLDDWYEVEEDFEDMFYDLDYDQRVMIEDLLGAVPEPLFREDNSIKNIMLYSAVFDNIGIYSPFGGIVNLPNVGILNFVLFVFPYILGMILLIIPCLSRFKLRVSDVVYPWILGLWGIGSSIFCLVYYKTNLFGNYIGKYLLADLSFTAVGILHIVISVALIVMSVTTAIRIRRSRINWGVRY